MTYNQTTKTSLPLEEAGSAIGTIASDIKAAATSKFDETVSELRSKAVDAKSGVANEVNDVALALRRASGELRSGSAQERTLGNIASGLVSASESIRGKDIGEILQMIRKVGRENPVLFLGGSALLGFAASRYAKASGDVASTSTKTPFVDQQTQEAAFVDDGNPNTLPTRAAK